MHANGTHSLSTKPDLFNLKERTIIITGGLGSLGVALTKTLLQYGADVVSLDVAVSASNAIWESLSTIAAEVNGQVAYISCDVTSEESVESALAQAIKTCRFPIRGLVTCAGISGRHPAVEYPIEEFRRIMDINVTGTFLCARSAARIMHEQNVSGSIVMFASMSGTNVNKGVDTAAYNSSKSAVLQLARNLAAEWANDGEHPPIRVNSISPGYIMTPMTVPTFEALPELKKLWPEGNMLGRMSTVEEHQSSVVFLLADSSSYMTASDLRVDAGHCAW